MPDLSFSSPPEYNNHEAHYIETKVLMGREAGAGAGGGRWLLGEPGIQPATSRSRVQSAHPAKPPPSYPISIRFRSAMLTLDPERFLDLVGHSYWNTCIHFLANVNSLFRVVHNLCVCFVYNGKSGYISLVRIMCVCVSMNTCTPLSLVPRPQQKTKQNKKRTKKTGRLFSASVWVLFCFAGVVLIIVYVFDVHHHHPLSTL